MNEYNALYENVLATLSVHAMLRLDPGEELFSLLEEECATTEGRRSAPLRLILAEHLIFRGSLQAAEQSLEPLSDEYRGLAASVQGWLALLQGNHEKAIERYTMALTALRKESGKRKAYFNGMVGLFFILALLKTHAPQRLREAEDHANLIARQSKHWLASIYSILQKILQIHQGDLSKQEEVVGNTSIFKSADSLRTLFGALALYWLNVDQARKRLPAILKPFYERAAAAGYRWLAMEAAELLARLEPRSHYGAQAAALRKETAVHSLIEVISPQQPWELCLNALVNLNKQPDQQTMTAAKQQRLAWFINVHRGGWALQPREQTLDARGRWSKGRNIALTRLSKQPDHFPYLTPQDLLACAHIHEYSYGY